jgi:hypothetical protein
MRAHLTKVEVPVDASQQVIARDVIVKVERVEESILAATLLTHHLDVLPPVGCHQDRSSDPKFRRVFQQNQSEAVFQLGRTEGGNSAGADRYPLVNRHTMDDVVDQVRRRLRHAPGNARRAEPAPFTTAVQT